MPKVSIIIPVYKTEKYIHQCVDSVRAQTFSDIEIILVDDGSPDKCPGICDEYAIKDGRVKVIHQENSGVSAARNAGLAVCSGEYLLFVDADDYIDEKYVYKLIDEIEKGYDLVCCGYYDISKYGIVKCNDFYTNKFNREQLVKCIINGTGGVLWGKIFRTKIIQKYYLKLDERLFMSEDMIFVLEYVRYITCWFMIEDVLYNYNRLNENSISSNINSGYLKNYENFYQSQLKCLENLNMSKKQIEEIFDEKIPRTLCALFEKTKKTSRLTHQIKEIDFFSYYLKIGSQKELILKLALKNKFVMLEFYLGLKKFVYCVGRSVKRFIRMFK